MAQVATPGPTVLDALSLLAEVGDELVVRTVRDTHLAVLDRTPAGRVHRGITTAVYRGLTGGLGGAGRALDRAAATGVGPRLEADPRGRFVSSAVNGLIGDRLLRERPQLAIPMAVRLHGSDVEPERAESWPRRSRTPPASWWSSCTGCARTRPTGTVHRRATATAPARPTPRCWPSAAGPR